MNYSELVDLIKDYVEVDEDTFNNRVDDFIRLAEEEIYRTVQIPELRTLKKSTTSSGDRFLGLPTDYLSTYSLSVEDGDVTYLLISKEPDFIMEAYPEGTKGRPRYFGQHDDGTFILGPTPDDAYTVELRYFYKPDSIVSTGTSWLGKYAENALLWGSLVNAYTFLKGEQDLMAQYQQNFLKSIADLKLLVEGRQKKDSYRNSDRRLPV